MVAIAWQALFARSLHTSLTLTERAALFASAWLIYLADRFADALRLGGTPTRSARQDFCVRHRAPWIAMLACSAVGGLVISSRLDGSTLRAGVALGCAAAVYLAANAWTRVWRFIPVKELAIGTLFAAGVVLVPAARANTNTNVAFFAAAISFAAICALNCLCIAAWERDLDVAQEKLSAATEWPGLDDFLIPACLAVAGLAVILNWRTPALAISLATSAGLLAVLHRGFRSLKTDTRTALADLVLLTPLVVALFSATR